MTTNSRLAAASAFRVGVFDMHAHAYGGNDDVNPAWLAASAFRVGLFDMHALERVGMPTEPVIDAIGINDPVRCATANDCRPGVALQ